MKQKEDFGFIANEIEEEFPFLVNKYNDYQNVNYNSLIALLVKETQELKKKVYELEQK